MKISKVNIYKFRVIVDTEQDVFRDIEIETDATFEQLHEAVLDAFDFESGEMASFYMSNEQWEKGLEIPLMDMAGDAALSMKSTKLSDMLSKPSEKVLYVYDFMRMWIFYVELMEVKKDAPSTIYPRVALVYGDAPSQDSKEMEAMFDDGKWEEEEKWDAASGDEDEDEFGFNDDENFDADDFDGYYDER